MKLTVKEILNKYKIEKDFGSHLGIRLLDKESGELVGFLPSSEFRDNKTTDIPVEICQDAILLNKLNHVAPEYTVKYIR